MSAEAVAIYEKGKLRLLTPLPLPERTRVRVRIFTEDEYEDELRRAVEVLIAAGVLTPDVQPRPVRSVSRARRAELASLYATGGPLSEAIIAERDTR